jgi:AraC-like DNA-binding protein
VKEIFPFYHIGHFINQPHNPTEFEITSFADMDEPEVEDFHKHTFYEIIWIESGESRQVIDYQEYEIRPGSLFFISPGQLHHFAEWHPVTGGSIMFTADFFLLYHQDKDKLWELSFLDNFYANACVQPEAGSYAEMQHTIHLMRAEHQRPDRSPTICQALLQVLLAQVQRAVDAQTPQAMTKKQVVLYKKFTQLLEAHFLAGLTASDYAARLSVTQHHLNEVIRTVTGRTTTEAIRARSLLEAKRLLTFTDLTVSEVAAQLGFFDSSYFAKLFRAEVGLSPVAFKSSISEKYRIR